MKILITAATGIEISPLLTHLEKEGNKKSFFKYEYLGNEIYPLVTGIGAMQTAFGLSRFSEIKTIDLAINLGICGAYDRNLNLGEVVEIEKDRFGDLGVEDKDGSFSDLFELELENPNRFPFKNGWLENLETKIEENLQKVTGLTVNKVSGSLNSIEKITAKYNAQVESMEGAAFFHACKLMDVDCAQIRSVSNYVEPRNRDNWKLELALDNLNEKVIEILKKTSKKA